MAVSGNILDDVIQQVLREYGNSIPFSISDFIGQGKKSSSERTEEGRSECPSYAPTMQTSPCSSDEISIEHAHIGHRKNVAERRNGKFGCSGHHKPSPKQVLNKNQKAEEATRQFSDEISIQEAYNGHRNNVGGRGDGNPKPTPKQVINKYQKVKLMRKENVTEANPQFATRSKQKPKENMANGLGTQSGNGVYCKKSSEESQEKPSYITVMEYVMPAPTNAKPQIFKTKGAINKVIPEKGCWRITRIKKLAKQSFSEDSVKIEKIAKEKKEYKKKQKEYTTSDAYPSSGTEMIPKKTKKKKSPEEKEKRRQWGQSRQFYLNKSIYRRSLTSYGLNLK